ncbi:MAG TPA: UDP-N-acetylmuramate dehydrogenase [Armatimonadota bacterium]|jgi:UDP-N-acetylmuramate dehydrogenase|nr:UDP-N-acetylmuramate dehydrogenase [Armatimonadota bacterium]HOQ28695.1 UDP-N-acetylmuramate dehydrogenase [Armatimonadota bacterium]HPO74029.1 UDP-N-acetylmuramate dehydrogenase [Armatimonadota bacterium]
MGTGLRVERDYSLRECNTFGVEAKAAYYARVTSREELAALLQDNPVRDREKLVLGGGSNILFTRDFDGVVIHNAIGGIAVVEQGDREAVVEAGAGVVWHDLVLFCLERDFGGLENLALIPGSVGASPIQNIGAYGVEMKDAFESLDALEVATGRVRTFGPLECCFGYRNSVFKQALRGQYIVLAVRFRLTTRDHRVVTSYGALQEALRARGIEHPTPRDIADAVTEIRRQKLPDPAELGNAGSFFKNPEVSQEQYEALKREHPGLVAFPTPGGAKIAAGWLIEQCGWKGKRVGNTGAHARQALVLVNYGGATGREIYALAQEIQASVLARFGISLEMEVNLV